jgi:hypothetical protein
MKRTLAAVVNGVTASRARREGLVEDSSAEPSTPEKMDEGEESLFLSDEDNDAHAQAPGHAASASGTETVNKASQGAASAPSTWDPTKGITFAGTPPPTTQAGPFATPSGSKSLQSVFGQPSGPMGVSNPFAQPANSIADRPTPSLFSDKPPLSFSFLSSAAADPGGEKGVSGPDKMQESQPLPSPAGNPFAPPREASDSHDRAADVTSQTQTEAGQEQAHDKRAVAPAFSSDIPKHQETGPKETLPPPSLRGSQPTTTTTSSPFQILPPAQTQASARPPATSLEPGPGERAKVPLSSLGGAPASEASSPFTKPFTPPNFSFHNPKSDTPSTIQSPSAFQRPPPPSDQVPSITLTPPPIEGPSPAQPPSRPPIFPSPPSASSRLQSNASTAVTEKAAEARSTNTWTFTTPQTRPESPPISRSRPQPKTDRRPRLLDKLAKAAVLGEDGIMDQFLEHTIGTIVSKSMKKLRRQYERQVIGKPSPALMSVDVYIKFANTPPRAGTYAISRYQVL